MSKETLMFLDMFSAYQPNNAIIDIVKTWKIEHAEIDQKNRVIEVSLLGENEPDEALLIAVEQQMKLLYQLESFMIRRNPVCIDKTDNLNKQQCSEEENKASNESDVFLQTERLRQKAIDDLQTNAKNKPKSTEKLVFGNRLVKGKTTDIATLNLDMGTVNVQGDVFSVSNREYKKGNAYIISFEMTDYRGSIRINKFISKEQGQGIVDHVKEGVHVLVKGRLTLGKYDGDLEIDPQVIQIMPKEVRTDLAPKKRVELHLHTKMSNMDALTDPKKVVARAGQWGHSAVAITDHGVVHAFPDAWGAGKKANVKVLLGMEAYFINNVDGKLVVNGEKDMPLSGSFVVFDIETTGLSKIHERLTEIGAVLLEDGEVKERFQTFVNPEKPIPYNITQLTGISDEMVLSAPSQKEAVLAFLEFAKDYPLVAHNAEFDMGFMYEAFRRYDIQIEPTSIDTLPLAQKLLPELGRYKLNLLAKHFQLPDFNHHRASDDAETTAYILKKLFSILEEKGVSFVREINPMMAQMNMIGKVKRKPKHMIILAKNKTGLRNLYKLVSISHLEYFKRVPTIPKSLLLENREGLIIGAACEAGEIYDAIKKGKSWSELKRIASMYDFLEIQPLSNNAFMLRPDRFGESQAKNIDEIKEWNRTVVKLGRELGKPVCATGDVHFLEPEEEAYRKILLDTKGFDDADSENPLYFRTTDEMLEEFAYLGEETAYEVVVENTNLVAGWCEDIKPLPDGLFTPTLENSAQELQDLVWGKVADIFGENPPELVVKRVETELNDIIGCKYDVIYMSAQKLVQDSLEHGYLVGSRGSVGSSIVAFLSGITEVNSLPPYYHCPNCKHSDFVTGEGYGCGADMPEALCPKCNTPYKKDGFNIPFETFLGFGGDKVPDIDLNFSGEYQASAHKYTFELFGQSHVFRAGTISTVADKTAYGYVKKYLDARNLKVTKAEENRLTLGCTKVKRTTGQHPGGMIVIPQDKEIYDFCPVQRPADDTGTDIITTHFEYHSMESNLLKLDILGHDDPSMIRMLEDLTGVNAREIPLDDPDTMSLFITSEKLGFEDDEIIGPTGAVAIPEFGTGFVRAMLEDTAPDQFDTLVRISGFSHGTDVWLGNARELILSGKASVTEAIGCRDDIMIYLIEQGMPEKRAFKIMEAVRKGRGIPDGGPEEMQALGIPEWYIESCQKIAYLFPKAHAVAYVMMAFRIAWFKVHRPLAFYAAYFSIRAKAFDATVMCRGMDELLRKRNEILAKDKDATSVEKDMLVTMEVCYEFYKRGFSFASMSIYTSESLHFQIVENQLIPPFVSVPGLGETAAKSIVENRVGKRFISIEEVSMAFSKLSETNLEQLRQLGALGNLPKTSQMSIFDM